MKPLIKLTKKQKGNLKRALTILWRDISYYHGGWLYFIVRMINGAFWLWLSFSFIWSWYFFVYSNVGITPDKIESLRNILWTFGLLFVVIRSFTFYEFDSFLKVPRNPKDKG